MAIELTFLGTSCMVPTKDRNVTGMFLSYKTYGILMDCGEGTQRQMNIAGINRNKVTHVLLSHWHGDHVSGLIGLIQTLGNQNWANIERPTLHVYGPDQTEERMIHLFKTVIFDNKVEIKIHEISIKKGHIETIIDNEDFKVEASLLDHGVPCLGYSFIEKDIRKIDMKKAANFGLKEGAAIGKLQKGETVTHDKKKITPEMVSEIKKGKKITFIMDTAPCEGATKLSQDADVLVCEATFASGIEEKAEHSKHMTAKSAALLANNANVAKLILTHLSQRYKSSSDVLEDAKDVFQNVDAAYDFMKVKI